MVTFLFFYTLVYSSIVIQAGGHLPINKQCFFSIWFFNRSRHHNTTSRFRQSGIFHPFILDKPGSVKKSGGIFQFLYFFTASKSLSVSLSGGTPAKSRLEKSGFIFLQNYFSTMVFQKWSQSCPPQILFLQK